MAVLPMTFLAGLPPPGCAGDASPVLSGIRALLKKPYSQSCPEFPVMKGCGISIVNVRSALSLQWCARLSSAGIKPQSCDRHFDDSDFCPNWVRWGREKLSELRRFQRLSLDTPSALGGGWTRSATNVNGISVAASTHSIFHARNFVAVSSRAPI